MHKSASWSPLLVFQATKGKLTREYEVRHVCIEKTCVTPMSTQHAGNAMTTPWTSRPSVLSTPITNFLTSFLGDTTQRSQNSHTGWHSATHPSLRLDQYSTQIWPHETSQSVCGGYSSAVWLFPASLPGQPTPCNNEAGFFIDKIGGKICAYFCHKSKLTTCI